MRDLLLEYQRLAAGGPVGRAVVTSVWGSAPRPEGACLLARTDGTMAGSVSGGCVESAVVEEIGLAILRGTPKLTRFSVSDETAWGVGLACGGTIEILIEPAVRPNLLAAAETGGKVVATVVAGPVPVGAYWLIGDDGLSEGPTLPVDSLSLVSPDALATLRGLEPHIVPRAAEALKRQASFAFDIPGEHGEPMRVFLEFFPRQSTLLIFGATHVAMTLVSLAKRLGYRTVVADGRGAFLTRERFPEADELVLAWPDEAFSRVGIDRGTYVCILSHDPKFDETALEIALRSQAMYVGAIGSRKTQQARRERLAASGIAPDQIARLHGPIGLDLGGKEPAETALAILAEMTMARHGRLSPLP
jgi:xanthine dehydrogenase accessory factor